MLSHLWSHLYPVFHVALGCVWCHFLSTWRRLLDISLGSVKRRKSFIWRVLPLFVLKHDFLEMGLGGWVFFSSSFFFFYPPFFLLELWVCLSSPCLLAPGASHEKSGDLPESPGNKPLHSHCCPVPLSLFSSGFENPENFKVHVFHPIREVWAISS